MKTWLEASMLQTEKQKPQSFLHTNHTEALTHLCHTLRNMISFFFFFLLWFIRTAPHCIWIFWSVRHGTVNVRPFTDVSTRSHYISVFNQLLIIRVSRGPLICLSPEHLQRLLRSRSHTWSMPPALFLSQRLSKGNNQTMTLSKPLPFVLNTS